jgi:hypothetical protein
MNTDEVFKVYQFDKKIRLGVNRDGGYVLGDLNENYDCYISAGISNEESFSSDFINKYGMTSSNSFGFDGTMKDYPYRYTKNISFVKKNINSFNDDNNTNLLFLTNKFNNIFLKMDIDGAEYPWLQFIANEDLNKFKQIVIEFHGITDDGFGFKNNDKLLCLEKLTNTHYLIHAHGNNYGPVVNKMPDLIELTYVNKKYFNSAPQLNSRPLPIIGLDYPNKLHKYDINLNFEPFVTQPTNPLKQLRFV